MSGAVRGPTPIAMVNAPTNVPTSPNACAAMPMVRVHDGRNHVNASAARSTLLITLSAVVAR